jgi:hypothetical protein
MRFEYAVGIEQGGKIPIDHIGIVLARIAILELLPGVLCGQSQIRHSRDQPISKFSRRQTLPHAEILNFPSAGSKGNLVLSQIYHEIKRMTIR